jgi:hypothetical protein
MVLNMVGQTPYDRFMAVIKPRELLIDNIIAVVGSMKEERELPLGACVEP